MHYEINSASRLPIYQQLVRQVREAIARGDLKFRLHGEKLSGTWALVRMKNRGKGNEWLIIKKKDEAAHPAWDIEDYAYSVKTGRTQEEIAADLPAHKLAQGDKALKKKR